jgi:hypothetical protein
MNPIPQTFCNDAIEKLSVNKTQFLEKYQTLVDDSDKTKIHHFHYGNLHLVGIVRDFVSFYYNGEVGWTKNLLDAANASPILISNLTLLLKSNRTKFFQLMNHIFRSLLVNFFWYFENI